MLIEKITNKPVKILRSGPNERTVVIKHQDGTTQIQFKSLLREVN